MNDREYEAVLEIERAILNGNRKPGDLVPAGLSFSVAADRYMMYGTGDTALREQERAEWNKRVEARKQVKRDMKRWRK